MSVCSCESFFVGNMDVALVGVLENYEYHIIMSNPFEMDIPIILYHLNGLISEIFQNYTLRFIREVFSISIIQTFHSESITDSS